MVGRSRAPDAVARAPALAPAETVRVVERTPAETIRIGASSSPPAGVAAPTRPASPQLTREAEGAYRVAEARALARRVRAASAGASPEELAPGDADARAADALARAGRYAEASARLATAIDRWTSADLGARGRPRRSAGGQGLRAEIEQVASEFAGAFSAKSLPRIRGVYPRMTEDQAQEWGQLFLRARDITMQLGVTGVNRAGPAEVEATLAGSYDYTEMQGGTAGRQQVSWQATLRQSPLGWRIVALR